MSLRHICNHWRLNTHCEIFKYLKLHSFRTNVQFQKKKEDFATFFYILSNTLRIYSALCVFLREKLWHWGVSISPRAGLTCSLTLTLSTSYTDAGLPSVVCELTCTWRSSCTVYRTMAVASLIKIIYIFIHVYKIVFFF